MHHRHSCGGIKKEDRFRTAVDPIEVFRERWGIYQTVIREDYMFHREISAAVGKLLDAVAVPLRFLDLGCGDACQIGKILKPGDVVEYRGCDLSAQALDVARENLLPFGNSVQLLCMDMLAVLKAAPANHFDAAYSCFALHHLPFLQKKMFFTECRRVLRDGGVFILADIMREEDESPAAYFERYIETMERDWLKLTETEQAGIQEHIRSCDYPEPPSVLESMALEAGFRGSRRLEKRTWHQAWCYRA